MTQSTNIHRDTARPVVLLWNIDSRILFVNNRCGHLLQRGSSKPKGQTLVGRSLWEWMDAQDQTAVVAAIGICLFRKDATRRVHCTLNSSQQQPRGAVQPRGAMQQQTQQETQHYRQQWQRQQDTIRADLTFRLSERGVIVFMRPDNTGGGRNVSNDA